ncbi:MAG TPA: winged helix-turn-helix domain-containing protein, partial [Gemmatimonadaceae bacterium]|nr:winged helix-turn-helix domain-containing protein [Gemmatimonadaceae bacterium]
DNMDFVAAESLEDSLVKALAIVEILEHDRVFINLNPKCEPQLGRRGLYRNTGGTSPADFEMSLLWVLNMSDGRHSLLDIAERAGMSFSTIRQAADALKGASLLGDVDRDQAHRTVGETSAVPAPLRPARLSRKRNR